MTSESGNAAEAAGPNVQAEKPALRLRAKRLPAAERKALILREASLFFAREGFAASTRDLADQLGVRQALLYKYFPSKEALLEAIFEESLAVFWAMEWSKVLSDGTMSLEDRLTHFFIAHLEHEDGIPMRLFMRAALDGWVLPTRRLELVKNKFVQPLIAILRRDARLPSFETLPLMIGEFELAMVLHSSVIFYSIRTHVYGGDLCPDVAAVVRLYVTTFLKGAQPSLLALHGPDAPASFKLPVPASKSAS